MNPLYSKNVDFLRIANLVGPELKTEFASALQEVRATKIENWPTLVNLLPEASNMGVEDTDMFKVARILAEQPTGELACALSDRNAQAVHDLCAGRVPYHRDVPEPAGIDL